MRLTPCQRHQANWQRRNNSPKPGSGSEVAVSPMSELKRHTPISSISRPMPSKTLASLPHGTSPVIICSRTSGSQGCSGGTSPELHSRFGLRETGRLRKSSAMPGSQKFTVRANRTSRTSHFGQRGSCLNSRTLVQAQQPQALPPVLCSRPLKIPMKPQRQPIGQ